MPALVNSYRILFTAIVMAWVGPPTQLQESARSASLAVRKTRSLPISGTVQQYSRKPTKRAKSTRKCACQGIKGKQHKLTWHSPLLTIVLHNKGKLAATMLFGSLCSSRWHKKSSGAPNFRENEADAVSDVATDLESDDCSDSGSVPQAVHNEMHNPELLCTVAGATRQKQDQVTYS